MKKLIYIILAIILMGCASTQRFGKIEYDQYGKCMTYDTIRTVKQMGLISRPFVREKDVFYKIKPFPIIAGAVLAPFTWVAPVVFWGFFFWEPAFIKDGKWERIKKINP